MKSLIIVPAYNEEKNIYNVVTSAKKNNVFADVIVINDGSKDNTYFEAKRAGAEVINLSENLGIGGAVQTGYSSYYSSNFCCQFWNFYIVYEKNMLFFIEM